MDRVQDHYKEQREELDRLVSLFWGADLLRTCYLRDIIKESDMVVTQNPDKNVIHYALTGTWPEFQGTSRVLYDYAVPNFDGNIRALFPSEDILDTPITKHASARALLDFLATHPENLSCIHCRAAFVSPRALLNAFEDVATSGPQMQEPAAPPAAPCAAPSSTHTHTCAIQ